MIQREEEKKEALAPSRGEKMFGGFISFHCLPEKNQISLYFRSMLSPAIIQRPLGEAVHAAAKRSGKGGSSSFCHVKPSELDHASGRGPLSPSPWKIHKRSRKTAMQEKALGGKCIFGICFHDRPSVVKKIFFENSPGEINPPIKKSLFWKETKVPP